MMKITRIGIAIGISAALTAGGYGCYRLGYNQGHKQGRDLGAIEKDYYRTLNNVVFLTYADKREAAGDKQMAARLRRLMLLGSVQTLQEVIDSGQIDRATMEWGRPNVFLAEVASDFRRDPNFLDILDNDPARKHLKPKLIAIFDRHPQAELPDTAQSAIKPANAIPIELPTSSPKSKDATP